MNKAWALPWFVLCCTGAYVGGTYLARAPVFWLLMFTVVLCFVAWALYRTHVVDGTPRIVRVVLGASLTIALVASSAQRNQEFVRWERAMPRGSIQTVHGFIGDVRPYVGERLAVDVLLDDRALGRGWRLRLIAHPEDVIRAMEGMPADLNGRIAWPVRVYPPRPAGNPGEFDGRVWARTRGYVADAYLTGDAVIGEGAGEDVRDACSYWPHLERMLAATQSPFNRRAWQWRCRLSAEGDTVETAVALAMTLGQQDRVGSTERDKFSRAGVAHLLAVSGLHVGFIVTATVPLIAFVTRGRKAGAWIQVVFVALFVIGFVQLVGGPASALRAGIMAVGAFLARSLGRSTSSAQTLSLAGLLLLTYNPHYVFDLSFQLSFLATAGIAATASPLWKVKNRWIARYGRAGRVVGRVVGGVLMTLVMSAAAQGATLPLVAKQFSYVSWISPAANVPAAPLGAAVVLFHLAGLIAHDVFAPLSNAFLSIGGMCARLLVQWVDVMSGRGVWEVAMPSLLTTIGWYGAWLGATALLWGLVRVGHAQWIVRGRRWVIAGTACLVVAWIQPTVKSMFGIVDVWVLDVGQGDAILIEAPWERYVVIDGGGVVGRWTESGFDVGRDRVVPTLRRLGVARVDAVVNTHPHADHVQGLAAVISERDVGRVFASHAQGTTFSYRRFVEAARAKGLTVETFELDDIVEVSPGVSLRVLATGASEEGFRSRSNVNNRSVVLLMDTHYGRFVFLGDVEEEGIRRVLTRGADLRADGLLVPHHGSFVPALHALLDAVQPEVALISAGAGNRYGHPAPQTIAALRERNIAVARTDRSGAIRVRLGPKGLTVKKARRN